MSTETALICISASMILGGVFVLGRIEVFLSAMEEAVKSRQLRSNQVWGRIRMIRGGGMCLTIIGMVLMVLAVTAPM